MGDDFAKRMEAKYRAVVEGRLLRAAAFAANEIKITLSTPAPLAPRTKGRSPRAAIRATKGAPPRKITGRLRASIAYKLDRAAVRSVVGSNLVYAKWEVWGHPYVAPTLLANRSKITSILAGGT